MEDEEFLTEEANSIKQLMERERVGIIVGINVWRSSRLIVRMGTGAGLPKIMIIAGTDANVALKVPYFTSYFSYFCYLLWLRTQKKEGLSKKYAQIALNLSLLTYQ